MKRAETSGRRPSSSAAGVPPAGGCAAAETRHRTNTPAQDLERQLLARLAECRALYRRLAPAQIWLEGRIAFSEGPQKAEFEARKRELDRKADEAGRGIAEADAEIASLRTFAPTQPPTAPSSR